MADNVAAESVTTPGAVFATDDISGTHYPRTKQVWGADGVATDVAAGAAALPIQDGGNSITVDGSVTLGAAIPAGTNNIGDVDVLSLPALPAGNNNIGDVDVASLPALPAGNNNIGDVDVATLPTGSVAAATAKTADYDTGGGTDTVVMMGVALPKSGGAVAGGTSTDPLRVDPTGTTTQPVSGTVTANAGSGTFTVSGTVTANAGTGTLGVQDNASKVDDAAFTPASDRVLVVGAFADEAAPDSVDEGDAGALRMTLARALHVNLRDDAGDSVMDGGNNAVRVNIVAGAGSGGTAMTDDAAFTVGSTSFTPVGGTFKSARDTVNDNDGGAFAMTASRAMLAALETPNGDSAMDDTNDALRVNIVAGGGSGGTSATDSAAFTAASTAGTPIMGARDDAASDTLAEGEMGIARMTTNRAFHVNLRDASGTEVSVGGGTQYDEDTVSTAADKITMAGVVRKDTAATLVDTDGDRTQLQVDASGRLHVNGSGVTQPISASSLPLPTGAATETTLNAIKTSTELIDDSIITDDAAFSPGTTKLQMFGAEFDDAATDSVDEGDAGAVRMSANRNLYTTLRDAAGNERGANVNASNALLTAQTGALPAGTNNIGDVDVLTLPALPAGTNNIGDVDVLTLPALPAGNNNIGDVDIASMPGVKGTVAHDSADADAPVKTGGKATTALSGVTLVANNDVTDGYHGVDGVQIVRPHCNLEDIVTGTATITDGSSTSVISAAGSGVKIYVTSVVVSNSSATPAEVDIRDGTAGSVKLTLPVPPSKSGVIFNPPVPLPFSANTAIAADPDASLTSIKVTIIGFKSKV
jgi:hypothetical protein